MNNEIMTEDIIRSLIACSTSNNCVGCALHASADCYDDLMRMAADELKELNDFHKTQTAHLTEKLEEVSRARDELDVENELLRGALEVYGWEGIEEEQY